MRVYDASSRCPADRCPVPKASHGPLLALQLQVRLRRLRAQVQHRRPLQDLLRLLAVPLHHGLPDLRLQPQQARLQPAPEVLSTARRHPPSPSGPAKTRFTSSLGASPSSNTALGTEVAPMFQRSCWACSLPCSGKTASLVRSHLTHPMLGVRAGPILLFERSLYALSTRLPRSSG